MRLGKLESMAWDEYFDWAKQGENDIVSSQVIMVEIRFDNDLTSWICTQISNEALIKSHYHLNQNRLGHYSKTNEKTKNSSIFSSMIDISQRNSWKS
jgi:hypothetical protein